MLNTFLKLKTCNRGVKNAAECDQLSKSHIDLGLYIHVQLDHTITA